MTLPTNQIGSCAGPFNGSYGCLPSTSNLASFPSSSWVHNRPCNRPHTFPERIFRDLVSVKYKNTPPAYQKTLQSYLRDYRFATRVAGSVDTMASEDPFLQVQTHVSGKLCVVCSD